MPSFKPYRLPCEVNDPIPFLGSPFQHGLAPALLDQYVNTTVAPNPIAGGNTPPYTRGAKDISEAVGCEVFGNCVSPNWGPCQSWPRPFQDNTFNKSGQVNFAVAHKTGFKAVQAMRRWNGRYGYQSMAAAGNPDNIVGCPGLGTVLRWQGYQALPDRTKYQKLTVNASWHQTLYNTNGSVFQDSPTSCDYTITIDPNSGIYTITGFSLNPNVIDWDGAESLLPGNSNQAMSWASHAHWQWGDIISRMTNIAMDTSGFTVTYAAGGITVTDGGGNVYESLTWNINIGGTSTFERFQYQYYEVPPGTPPPQKFQTYHEKVTVTNTTIDYESTTTGYGCAFVVPQATQTIEISVTGTLGNPVTDTDVRNDAEQNLLSTWNLADDEQHPWRTDTRVGLAPLVRRDDKAINDFPQPSTWAVRDFGAHAPNGPLTAHPGDDMPLTTWDGMCGVITPPTDPDSGVVAVAQDFPGVTSGSSVTGSMPQNFYSAVLAAGYNGSFPTGVNWNAANYSWSGTASADGHWGVTFIIQLAGPNYTGGIVGAPLPAGYGYGAGPQGQAGVFQYGWLDYRACCYTMDEGCSGTCPNWSWYQYGYGGSNVSMNNNSRCQLPLNCTNWTNWWEALNKPQGAWLFFNDQTQYEPVGACADVNATSSFNADALWACKYAEILDVWPSQNFARPGGLDKFSFDETRVYCAANASGSGPGSTWNITNYDTTIPADGTDFSGIWGGQVVGGFYNVARYSGGALTLGAKVYDVPTGWSSAAVDSSGNSDTATCFGKLRFPDCPALLGRAAVTAVGGNFTFTVAQPTFGMNSVSHQEQIDICDANMNVLAANLTATRVDDSHFTITTPYAGTAAFIVNHGAPAWYMNDGDPKGDYVILEWNSDFRNVGEATRMTGITDCSGSQIGGIPTTNFGGGPVGNTYAFFSQTPGCVPFSPCAPKVVCISPNDEQFPNGVTYPFPPQLAGAATPQSAPNEFYFDETYGSKWWAHVPVTMVDLLWQQPHAPCGHVDPLADPPETLVWKMDDLSCQISGLDADTGIYNGYYKFHPLVECRLTVPCNYGQAQNECAPPLPAGIQLGWSSPVTAVAGDIAFPPVPPAPDDSGNPGGATTDFLIHAEECAAITAGCALNYKLPGC